MRLTSRVLALLLSASLFAAEAPKPTIAQQMVELPLSCLVELRLNDKRKLRGRLGGLGDRDFEIEVADQNTLTRQRFRYAEIQSVKTVAKMKAGRSAGFVAIGALAGIGGVMLILWAIIIAGGGD